MVDRVRLDRAVQVEVDQHLPVQEGDRIDVDETGRALLRFQDRLLMELFRNTGAIVSKVQLEPGDLVSVRLKQVHGHTRTQLESLAKARVTVETDYATIRALGTEFLVCHGQELTCMVTLQGEAEVEAQGQVVVVPAGESTYVLPGEPPKPPICTNQEDVNRWLDGIRGTAETGPLGALVAQWPQRPCATSSEPLPEASPVQTLPSREGMVKIESGHYQVGATQADDFHVAAQEIDLTGFWIDQYEVTNAQYEKFLKETGRPAPPTWSAGTFPSGREQHPAAGITWDEAAAYCTWENKRLPTEAEWEVAARGGGPKPPLYPWGTDPNAGGKVNQLPLTDTYAVGTMSFNKSPFGVYDAAGNVWEWVGEPYAPVADSLKILRGGRHGLIRDMAYRQPAAPDDERFRQVAGFRCAAGGVAGE
jgi:formylglycine-generating enzyme required for sulfatase activity